MPALAQSRSRWRCAGMGWAASLESLSQDVSLEFGLDENGSFEDGRMRWVAGPGRGRLWGGWGQLAS